MVGGAVRDTLLGLPVKDRDWVVVGATPQQMVDQGFMPVGRDFPVFLHPRTREEYALARTERKTAPGYRGFAIHAAPDVTLAQDLARRDLTINAMAVAAEDLAGDGSFDLSQAKLIDPHDGRGDLRHKLLRHVNDAFREDPVRILRVARFAARFTGFEVAPETTDLMRAMVAAGEVAALVPERVWQELARGLMEAAPVRMFEVLHACGALAILLPELGAAAANPDPIFADTHAMRVLAQAAYLHAVLPVRFACLCLHLGPAGSGAASQTATPPQGPAASARLARQLCQRLRVPTECRELAELAAREYSAVHGCAALSAAGLVTLLERCDAFRKPARFDELLLTCECDAQVQAATPDAPYPQRRHLMAALAAAQSVETELVAARAHAAGISGKQVGEMIHAERVTAVAAIA